MGVQRPVQRVDAAAARRHHAVFEQAVHGFGQCAAAAHVHVRFRRHQPAQLLPVLRERAGLVDAQHGGGPQRLHDSGPARQHLHARHAEGGQADEDRQHHRDLLRQHGHGERQRRQQALQPVAARQAVAQHQQPAERDGPPAEAAHQPPQLLLQRRRAHVDAGERGADASHLRLRAGRGHFGDAVARDGQGAGEHARRILATRRGIRRRTGSGHLAHRHRLAGEQRLVHLDAAGAAQHRVGGDALALGHQQEVARHDVGGRNADRRSAADHAHMAHRQRPQRVERLFAPVRLQHDQADRHHGEEAQQQAFAQFTDREVDGRRAEQQQEHRLAADRCQGGPPTVRPGFAGVVRAETREPGPRLVRAQALGWGIVIGQRLCQRRGRPGGPPVRPW